jgi:hypothetical protein
LSSPLHTLHILVVLGAKRNAILDVADGAVEISGPKHDRDMHEVISP